MPRTAWQARMMSAALVGVLGALPLAACRLTDDLGTACPTTVDEAAEMDFGESIVGGGYAIRFVPTADPAFRGYDVNLTRPVSERAGFDTYFLRTPTQLEGVADGDPVLLTGMRTDRAHVVVGGACPPLTVTTEEDVSWEDN